jgi:glycosyltransferase involved in cell wall biosynthesis
VAYDEAAAAQHIRHGHSGALAMPGDEAAFLEAAGWLLEDEENLRRVRLNARRHARLQGWEAIVEQLEKHLARAREHCPSADVAHTQATPPATRS